VPVTVGADGVLDIDLTAGVNNAKVSAIWVAVAGTPAAEQPDDSLGQLSYPLLSDSLAGMDSGAELVA